MIFSLEGFAEIDSEETFVKDEKVFYRRKNYKGWRGPGTVMAQDGNFVVVRHGKNFYRCHPCQLMKVVRTKSPAKAAPLEPKKATIIHPSNNSSRNQRKPKRFDINIYIWFTSYMNQFDQLIFPFQFFLPIIITIRECLQYLSC